MVLLFIFRLKTDIKKLNKIMMIPRLHSKYVEVVTNAKGNLEKFNEVIVVD